MNQVASAREKMWQKVIDMYKSGMLVEDICKANGITRAMVYYILRTRNIKLNHPSRQGGN